MQAICHHCPTPSNTWLDVLIILSHINSAGSPFLYAFHMKDFRQALRRLICKGAMSKHKLRDLRREELLFSISGHHRSRTQLHSTIPQASEPSTSTETQIHQIHLSHKGTASSRSLKQQQYRANGHALTMLSRDIRPKFPNVSRCCIEVDVDVEESKDDRSMSS